MTQTKSNKRGVTPSVKVNTTTVVQDIDAGDSYLSLRTPNGAVVLADELLSVLEVASSDEGTRITSKVGHVRVSEVFYVLGVTKQLLFLLAEAHGYTLTPRSGRGLKSTSERIRRATNKGAKS